MDMDMDIDMDMDMDMDMDVQDLDFEADNLFHLRHILTCAPCFLRTRSISRLRRDLRKHESPSTRQRYRWLCFISTTWG